MAVEKTVKKPLLCRLGFHQWYDESSMYISAKRCNRCLTFKDKFQGAHLLKERELWEQEKEKGTDFAAAKKNVEKALLRFRPNTVS